MKTQSTECPRNPAGKIADETVSRADYVLRLKAILNEKAQARAKTVPRTEPAFLRDTLLEESIQPCGRARELAGASAILLTGATGFLGAHLLADLCHRTGATIYCLVRAENSAAAMQRLKESVNHNTGTRLETGRIVALAGDMAKPGLGLAQEVFDELAGEVDAIFHNGALLNHLAHYEKLRAANVLSTRELLRLAGSCRPKQFHYVSSIVAAVDRDEAGALIEQFPTADYSDISGGYAQSKWASERLLAEASRRGFEVTIYRPGIIGGRTDSGAWSPAHDHLLLLLKACLQMGYAPTSSVVVDLTPVDFVSRAIVELSLSEPLHRVIHLSSPAPIPWRDLMDWLTTGGSGIKSIPFEEWQQHLAHADESNPLFPLLSLYLDQTVAMQREMLLTKLSRVCRRHTSRMLAALNLNYPIVGRELWQRYMDHLQRCGFLPLPEQAEIA